MKKSYPFLWIIFLIPLTAGFFIQKSYAETLHSVSDTITTSRPSASAPLNADQAANATSITTVDNGSIYLASDSATFLPDTGETGNYGVNVATMSAQIAGSPNTRTISFTSAITNAHHNGDVVIVPITAMHAISFTTGSQGVVSGGHVVIQFPGGGSNIASPSASTFSFNGLTSSNVKFNNVSCSGVSISAPNIDCTTSGAVAANTVITVLIGCSANSGASCTTQAPALINPTKSASNSCNNNSTTCTADTWKISVIVKNASAVTQDTGSAKIGTIESVQVSATVEPSLTFQITGLANGTNMNTISGCANELTNSGTSSTATNVNLGDLTNGTINIAGQELIVSTNGSTGYAIAATSSGRFIAPSIGFWIPDANSGNGLTANNTPAPATFGASGTPAFGINACGTDANAQWSGGSATAFSSGAKYSNPWNTGGNFFYDSISSATGPVSSDTTGIRYAATISGTTPAGFYSTILTYVATATF